MPPMRWTIRIGLVFLVLLTAYAAWPLMSLYRLAAAIETRNAAELADSIDLPLLRRSLTEQIVAEYLKLTGKASRLGALGTSFVVGMGATIADPTVARLLNLENLMDLLNKGSAGTGFELPAGIAPVTSSSLSSAWRTWLNTEYSGSRFYVSLPPDAPPPQQFKLRLNLMEWQWKLTGVELPEKLRVQFAQEVIRANPP